MTTQHGLGSPSSWLLRWGHLLQPGSRVLDVACGSGRHVRWLAAQDHAVTALDRDADALADLQGVAAEIVCADIENAPWPLPGRTFDAIVVTNYLWRPLLPTLLASLAPGGVLLYETFADGQQHIGRPARPEFLLQPGELLAVCGGLRVVGFEDGFDPAPPPGRCVQRIAALRPAAASDAAGARPAVPALAAPAAKLADPS